MRRSLTFAPSSGVPGGVSDPSLNVMIVAHTICHLIECGDKVLLILRPCLIEAGGRQHSIDTISLEDVAMRKRRLVMFTPYMGFWEQKAYSLPCLVNDNYKREMAAVGGQ